MGNKRARPLTYGDVEWARNLFQQVTSMKRQYNKSWLSIEEQISLLKRRGLIINDETAAAQHLQHMNYYRFTGYALSFQSCDCTGDRIFKPDTRFEDVIAVYDFDRRLRDLMFEASEAIEIDFRATIAHLFGEKHGAFGHIDSANFIQGTGKGNSRTPMRHFVHSEWHDKIKKEAMRARERFIAHYSRNYTEFPDLPIWILTEICSFGSLSTMFANMLQKDRTPVANVYGLQAKDAESMLHHIVYVRNICAHHARLWDRSISIKSTIPPGKLWAMVSNASVEQSQDVYISFVFHKWLYMSCHVKPDIVDDWCARANALISAMKKSYPHLIATSYANALTECDPIWTATCETLRNRKTVKLVAV